MVSCLRDVYCSWQNEKLGKVASKTLVTIYPLISCIMLCTFLHSFVKKNNIWYELRTISLTRFPKFWKQIIEYKLYISINLYAVTFEMPKAVKINFSRVLFCICIYQWQSGLAPHWHCLDSILKTCCQLARQQLSLLQGFKL